MTLKCTVVLLWVICLSCEVVKTGCEVVLVNRNVTDSFRVGKYGCTNNTNVCTSAFATCQPDGSCLCQPGRPTYRNPVIQLDTSGVIAYGDSYGCIDSGLIRFGGPTANLNDCRFKPFQVIPYSRNDPVTVFSHINRVFNCSLKNALAKFPDIATEMELQWLDESYVDFNISNNNMYFKWRRSAPELQGTIITFSLKCAVPGKHSLQTECLRAKILGTWTADAVPATTDARVSSTQPQPVPVTTITTANPKSTSSSSSDKECSDSNGSNTALIAVLAISLVANVVLGILVGFLWKKTQRMQNNTLTKKEMTNIGEEGKENTEHEMNTYDEVETPSGIHNDGIYDDSLPSSVQNNNGPLSDHKYEETSNYEPLRRNPSQGQSDDHNYQSLTTSQKRK